MPIMTYSKVHDVALVYEVKTKMAVTKQGSKTAIEYANFLQNQWQELDYYQVNELRSSEYTTVMKRFIARDQVYDFFAR